MLGVHWKSCDEGEVHETLYASQVLENPFNDLSVWFKWSMHELTDIVVSPLYCGRETDHPLDLLKMQIGLKRKPLEK